MKTCAAAVLVLLVGACANRTRPASPNASLPSLSGQAVIGRAAARFIFPREADTSLIWDVPTPDAFATRPDFYWTVMWEAPGPRGSVPIALTLVTYWRSGGPRQGTLSKLVGSWRPNVEIECKDCQETTWLGREDSAVVAQVVDGRVVMAVQGTSAIARIFPTVPDSVSLSRRRPDAEEELSIGVERREP